MRSSTKYGIVVLFIVFAVIILLYYAMSIDRIDILAEFLGILFGFLLAYVATEGMRSFHAEKEADQIIEDVRIELLQLIKNLNNPNVRYSFVSATGSWIKSQGLTYDIEYDMRKRILDSYTALENYSSALKEYIEYKHRRDADEKHFAFLEEVLGEKTEELRKDAELALDAINNR